MKKHFGLPHAVILILMLTLTLIPRLIFGFLDLKAAYGFEAAGNKLEAAHVYASAAARIPWMPSLWEKSGILAMEAGDVKNGINSLNKAVRLGGISDSGWLSLGKAYQDRGDLPSAVEAWQEAIPLPQAYNELALVERSMGNYSRAIEYWNDLIILEPENAPAHYALGLLLLVTEPESALPELMMTASLDPELDPTVQGLREALNTGLLSKDIAVHFLSAGLALSALGQWDLATEAFQQAIKERPGFAKAWAWLGEAKQHSGMDGYIEIKKALTLDAENAVVQGLYGMYLQRQDQPEAALAAFRKAAVMEPAYPGWQMGLGSVSQQAGDLVAAYDYYLHAVELAPDDASTWQALATFCVANAVDMDTNCLRVTEKLIAIAPEAWSSYDLAGQAELLLEDYPVAIAYLRKSMELDPTQAAPALHLGLVYLQSGEPSLAFSYLDLAITLDPDGSNGWQAGRLLEQYFP